MKYTYRLFTTLNSKKMSNLLDWNTLETRVNAFIDLDAGIDSGQKAFPVLMVATLLGLSDEESADAITDGPKDRGVDAVVVDENSRSVHIFQFKYVDKFENSKKNFPSGEIEKLTTYIVEMLDLDKSLKDSCNPLLWNKTQQIWECLKSPGATVHIHFCGNLKEMIPEEKARANAVFGRYKQFNVQHHSLESTVKLFLDGNRQKIDRTITAVDKDYFDRTDGSVRGLICSVEASEIVKMVTDPSDDSRVLDDLFNDNVRVYLSKTNKINQKIIESAKSDSSSLFWYLNNGITMTCDSYSYIKGKRAPEIALKNVQIVNGGQTTHALFEAFKELDAGLDDVLVLVRIIETKSEEFSLAIAESTNSQTPIKGRDLRSNDDIQKRLELSFRAVNYFYERKRNQWVDEDRSHRIDSVECAQAYAAFSLGMPEVAKKDRGRLFADLYDQVFTDELTIQALLCPYLINAEIDLLKKKVRKQIRDETLQNPSDVFLIDGSFHVLYAVSLLCKKKGIGLDDFPRARPFVRQAVNLVRKIVDQASKDNDTFSFNRFFKDAMTRELISAAALKETV